MMLNHFCLNGSERKECSQLLAPSRAIRPNGPHSLSEPKDLTGQGGTHMRMFEPVAVVVVMNTG
jgi:hypothetical protein